VSNKKYVSRSQKANKIVRSTFKVYRSGKTIKIKVKRFLNKHSEHNKQNAYEKQQTNLSYTRL
jgi:hypothetical protein